MAVPTHFTSARRLTRAVAVAGALLLGAAACSSGSVLDTLETTAATTGSDAPESAAFSDSTQSAAPVSDASDGGAVGDAASGGTADDGTGAAAPAAGGDLVGEPLTSRTALATKYDGAQWNVRLVALAAVDNKHVDPSLGQCYAVVGYAEPTVIVDGAEWSDSFVGEVTATVGGTVVENESDCDRDEALRKGWHLGTSESVTMGSELPFVDTFVAPVGAVLSSVVVGDAEYGEQTVFAAEVSPELPTAVRGKVAPFTQDLQPVPVSFEFQHLGGEEAWQVEVFGVVPGVPADGSDRACTVLLVRMTNSFLPYGIDTARPEGSSPTMSAVIDGVQTLGSSSKCTSDQAAAAGFATMRGAVVGDGDHIDTMWGFVHRADATFDGIYVNPAWSGGQGGDIWIAPDAATNLPG